MWYIWISPYLVPCGVFLTLILGTLASQISVLPKDVASPIDSLATSLQSQVLSPQISFTLLFTCVW